MEKQKTKVQNARHARELLVKLKRRLLNFSVRSQDGEPVGVVQDLGLEVADAKGYFNLIVLQSSAQQGDRLLIINSKHLKNIDIPNRTLFTALNIKQIEGLYKYPLPRSTDALKTVQQGMQSVRSGVVAPTSQSRAVSAGSSPSVPQSNSESAVILLPPIPSHSPAPQPERQTAERRTAERQSAERQTAERQYAERQIAERQTVERQPDEQAENYPETAWRSPEDNAMPSQPQSRQQMSSEQVDKCVELPSSQDQNDQSDQNDQNDQINNQGDQPRQQPEPSFNISDNISEARSPKRQTSPSLPEIPETPGIPETPDKIEESNVKEHIVSFQLLSERLKVNRSRRKAGEVVLRKKIETRMVEVPVRYEKLIVEQVGSKDRPLAEFCVNNGVVSEIKPGDSGASHPSATPANLSDSSPERAPEESSQAFSSTSQPLVKGVFPSIASASIVLDTIAQMPRHHCEQITVNLWINSRNPEKTSHVFTSPAAANAVLDAIANNLQQQCQKVEIELLLNQPGNQDLYQKWFDRYSD